MSGLKTFIAIALLCFLLAGFTTLSRGQAFNSLETVFAPFRIGYAQAEQLDHRSSPKNRLAYANDVVSPLMKLVP